jgi:transcriptional regulator with XRE-family HTH domain
MCQRRLPGFQPATGNPRLCSRLFGELIRHCREQDGRPLEELGRLAGLTPAQWGSIEAGQSPDCVEQVLLLATALRLGDSWLAALLRLCAQAQEN